jgi:hypothetical protein
MKIFQITLRAPRDANDATAVRALRPVLKLAWRRFQSTAVWIAREDQAWLVLARGHGWLFGCYREALREVRWLSRNLDFSIRGEVAP